MDTELLGTSVPLGSLGKELKKLWESAAGEKTRASMVNFAVYCEGAEALASNTKLIEDFTREYSCRAILIHRDRTAATPGAEAFVNAHCYLPRAGAKAVCCEQITLLISGSSNQLLSNVLFANLDSDLPLYLWWQGNLIEPIDDFLWTWVDRLIFDSRDWSDPTAQFTLLDQVRASAGSRMILCDLNWTRTLHLRQALAQMFDHPEMPGKLPTVKSLSLTYGSGCITTAKLFAAWIGAQLGWKVGTPGKTFLSASGTEIALHLLEAPGASVSRCEMIAEGGTVTLQRDQQAPFYRAEMQSQECGHVCHLLPAGQESLGCLLDEELALGGRHKVYLKALNLARELL